MKKARSRRVQLGAMQKFDIVVCPPTDPGLPSPPPQGNPPPACWGRGGEPGRPAGSLGQGQFTGQFTGWGRGPFCFIFLESG